MLSQNWKRIRALLANGGFNGIVKRIQRINMKNLPAKTLDEVKEMVSVFSIDQLKRSSTAGSAFLAWVS